MNKLFKEQKRYLKQVEFWSNISLYSSGLAIILFIYLMVKGMYA